MTERVKAFLKSLKSGELTKHRVSDGCYDISDRLTNIPSEFRTAIAFEEMIRIEKPIINDGDIFGFNRYNTAVVKYNCGGDTTGYIGENCTPNYARVMHSGYNAILEDIRTLRSKNPEKSDFYDAAERYVHATLDISRRYKKAAQDAGNTRLAKVLEKIPEKPAESFYEACVFMKLMIYTLRAAECTHLTLGRFDQYMYPFFEADIKNGMSREELFEILELFFISLNIDSDLYPGAQKGDNGQSLMLGGYDKDGNDMYNELSQLCLDASYELCLIDPKINLRVNSTTPIERYEYCMKLTRQGLGFPQFCNDDIAVPFLLSLGYDEEDVFDYTVAACWEFIVPNKGADIPNYHVLDFPSIVNNAIKDNLLKCSSFDMLLEYARKYIIAGCQKILERVFKPQHKYNILSVYTDGCLESGVDYIKGGAKYYNTGCHGAGIAIAADSLCAVKHAVFDEKTVTPETLLAALDADYCGYTELQSKLLSYPKMGNNIDEVDLIASELMDAFADNLNNRPNGNGGVWRAGTGSALEYIRLGKKCPATADGRNAGEPYASSFSPSITTKLNGPLSVISSFTKYDLKKISNGGPLTMELHDNVFRNADGEKKVAQLVKTFITLGGHQLQLNTINRDRLLDAQKHPEKYPNLIVRVWGWSGYFCELDPEYQNHIIRRTEFTV